MGRRVVEVTAGDLDVLPERCRHCLFWEVGAPRPIESVADGVIPTDELAGDTLVQKTAWWRSQELETGSPGRAVRIDGSVAGWVQFGPPATFARRRAPVPRASDDALFIATLWVEPAERGGGVGRQLIQAVVKEAIHRHVQAVEVYGDRRHRDSACVLPVTWLLHEGFEVHREHPRYPLMRIDVRSVVRWAEPLEQALEHALARLGRRTEPQPAPQRSRTAGTSGRGSGRGA